MPILAKIGTNQRPCDNFCNQSDLGYFSAIIDYKTIYYKNSQERIAIMVGIDLHCGGTSGSTSGFREREKADDNFL